MKLSRIVIAALVLVTIAAGPSCARRKGELGTKQNPVALFFMSSKDKAAMDRYVPGGLTFYNQNISPFLTN